MKKKEIKVETAGKVNWEKLEAKPVKKKKRASLEELPDVEGIEEEKKNLTSHERSLPYPEEFLADINLLRKRLDGEKAAYSYVQKKENNPTTTSQKIGANPRAKIVKKKSESD
ncbi:MAG: hypothetical protein NZ521_01280 [Flammeovirgaceae bacterium]|nr:hypothetical protein [Flammeovirgaceae bacterium]MDW8286606.1 hypothetical protein [Flammeovirgaceae bacterium]